MTPSKIAEYLDTESFIWNGLELQTTVLCKAQEVEGLPGSRIVVVERHWMHVGQEHTVDLIFRRDGFCKAIVSYRGITATFQTREDAGGEVEVEDIPLAVLGRAMDLWREYMREWEV